jgi:tetratricopeptide (TPR) repeat protein
MSRPASSFPNDSAEEEREFDRIAVGNWREQIRRSTLSHYHHRMGMALEASGDRDAALRAFERAVAVDPGRYASVLRLSRLLREAGDLERARSVLVHGGAPDALAQALMDEAETARDDGMTDDALALVAHALATGPLAAAAHRPDVVVELAGQLRDRHEEALRWCDLAAPYAQDRYGLHHQRGFSLLLLNRQDEARRELAASIILAPDRMPSWYVLGQYHRLRFETEAALTAYRHVWESGHDLRWWAGLMIAQTLLSAGRLREAMAACDAVRLQNPAMGWAHMIGGLVQLHAGDLDAAARVLDGGWLNDPDTARGCVFRGMLKLAWNRPQEALEDFSGERGDFACLALPRLGRARALLELDAAGEASRLVGVAVRDEGQWIAATLRLLGPLGQALGPLLAAVGLNAPPVAAGFWGPN